MTRLIAIGLLLAAIVTVFAGSCGGAIRDIRQRPRRRPTGGTATTVAAVHEHLNRQVRHGDVKTTTAKPPAKPKSHKPARPIPLPGKTPVMVLNSNGIHGVAHQLAARVQGAGYPITYVGNAQKRGLPTIVQYAKGYGPAARKLARLVGNVQFVTPFDGITPSQAKGAKLVVILGT